MIMGDSGVGKLSWKEGGGGVEKEHGDDGMYGMTGINRRRQEMRIV